MISWPDIALHMLGAAAIMAVFIAGAVATSQRIVSIAAGLAVNLAYWPWREIDQHGLRLPWHYGVGSLAEMAAPVLAALILSAIGVLILYVLDL